MTAKKYDISVSSQKVEVELVCTDLEGKVNRSQ